MKGPRTAYDEAVGSAVVTGTSGLWLFGIR
jgi:hypothetical protein